MAGRGRIIVIAAGLLAACALPPLRPQLDEAGAARFTREQVLGLGGDGRAPRRDGWDPRQEAALLADAPPRLDYRVDGAAGAGSHASIQDAVNQAHVDALAGRHAGKARLFIGIAPGRYRETVVVPAGPLPISLWGLGTSPAAVRIEHRIDAGLDAAAYAALLAPVYGNERLHADVRAPYLACSRPEATRTRCSTVLWISGDGFHARRLTVANADGARPGDAVRQAVALQTDGADRVWLDEVQLLGHQDTLYLRSRGGTHIARSYLSRSRIEGDVDFIFGNGTAFIEDSVVHHAGARRGQRGGWIAAPSTALQVPYGFVFSRSRFTADAGASGVALARQWFAGARCSPYALPARDATPRCLIVDGALPSDAATLPRAILESVGKMAVLDAWLGPHLDSARPWQDWQADRRAANHRPVQRDSHDFWQALHDAGLQPEALGYRRDARAAPFLAEYRNHGPGAVR